MSRCFTWFPNCLVLGEPNIYHQSVCFTRIGDFTWRVSDCEELVGVTWRLSDSVKNWWELLTGDDLSDLAMSISV